MKKQIKILAIFVIILISFKNITLATTDSFININKNFSKEQTPLLVSAHGAGGGSASGGYHSPGEEPVDEGEQEKPTLGSIISGANNFLSKGEREEDKLKEETFHSLSDSIYNILFVLGLFIAIIVGVILGIKFITEGAEGKAEVKNMLITYVVGCVVLFGSFTIWKIVVTMLQNVTNL